MNLRRSSTFSPISVEKIVLGGDGVLQSHLQQRARLRIHRGFPELLGIHFAQALEPRDAELLLGVLQHVSQHCLRVFLAHFVAIVRDGERRLIVRGELPAAASADACNSGEPASAQLMRRSTPLRTTSSCRLCSSSKPSSASIFSFSFSMDFGQRLQFLLVLEVAFLLDVALRQQFHQPGIAQTPPQPRGHLLILLHVEQKLRSARRPPVLFRPCL